ncbi:homoserine dehydrogenase [Natronospirillum operosum]|uniref:Homoserine dehydrogenase n=1 Tax=Natronospirillum operosum TaxID=2759953 RepID=A0A4Z0WCE0_9GAMM|nr:homoserine dehydrogenase [Natronospirillum operosum]TGG95862.1 homoserine dehydrogenase [Natronospirillum operosum]
MKPVNVGICGLGTVGSGTFNVLNRNNATIDRRTGREVRITHVGARRDHPDCDLSGVRVSRDIFDVVRDPDVHIVVELIGGTDTALELVLAAIAEGKHVVTANKALIAQHGNEIFKAAEDKGVTVAFEASVAGGIPIIKALREGLVANEIDWLAGIINGTGNFILTEMQQKGRLFDDVLKEAQELGYAEADPTFDVEGIDAAHKLTILASIAYGVPLQFESVYTEGISLVTPEDVRYAEELGYRIKHLGIARRGTEGVEMRVHPTLVPESRLLANVNGVLNAVLVHGDAVGSTLYYGPGAGAEATASSVIADIVDVAREVDSRHAVPHLGNHTWAEGLDVVPMASVETSYYLRMQVTDEVGVMARIANILSDSGINIEAIIQKEPEPGDDTVPLILLTQRVLEREMNAAIDELEGQTAVIGKVTRIRVEQLGGE